MILRNSSVALYLDGQYVKVYSKYAQLDLTTPTLCHAFFSAGSVLSNDDVDWERMEGPAQKLIYADWSDCLGFVKKSAEEELMQPIINEILSEVLGEDFPMKKWAKEHWFLVDSKGKKEDCFGNQRPDGVVLSSGTPHTRALLIEEFKVLEGSGDPFVHYCSICVTWGTSLVSLLRFPY